MKKTSLYDNHVAARAAIVPFAGWAMPVSYTGTVGEVGWVRTHAGVFDVSHMGEFLVSGPAAAGFLQRVTTNDIGRLAAGQAQYSLLLNDEAGVVDDIIVYALPAGDTASYMVVVNAGCKDKDWDWLTARLEDFSNEVVTLEDISDRTALIALQGPAAPAIAQALAPDVNLSALGRFEFADGRLGGMDCRISRTGYTGEDGFEVFCAWESAPALWSDMIAAGAKPAGLGARDVLRLEAAYSLYGHELDMDHSPWESGVGWAVRLDKGAFHGRDQAVARKANRTEKLIGLKMAERAIPRDGFAVYDSSDEPIGRVTSGTFSPTISSGIALARVAAAHATLGNKLVVDIRGRRAVGEVVRPPFYRNGI